MQKNVAIVAISAVLAGGVIFYLGHISPASDLRVGTREIYEQRAPARRQLDEAAMLMDAPVYRVEGAPETPPLPRLVATDRIIPESDAVNPKAWTAIESADVLLAKAMADHPDADKAVRSLGWQLLAEINKLKGGYHDERAAIARRNANAVLALVDETLETVALGRGSAELQESLVDSRLRGPGNNEVVGMRQQAADAGREAKGELARVVAAIDGLRDDIKAADVRIDGLAAEELALRQQSQAHPSAVESSALLQEVLVVVGQIDELKNVIVAKNAEILLAEQQEELLHVKVEAADGRFQAAGELLARWARHAESDTTDIQRPMKVVAAAEKRLVVALADLAATGQEASEANVEATKYFHKALANIDRALDEIGNGDMLLVATKAQLLALSGKTRMDNLILAGRVDSLVDLAAESYGEAEVSRNVSEGIAVAQASVASPDGEGEIMINELRDSVELFERVVESVSNEKQANYNGQLAVVYFMLFQNTGKETDRSNGEKRLADAKRLRGKLPINHPLGRIELPLGPQSADQPPVSQ